ncbi:hypothetical protein [Amycolatopsis sp. PS_44_ISF1]|uniref:hypothetical protein n=1 Tax=Amycolatopsis sp. PS_44_ISF1 TaxID=2974917 RepID=UPI0028DF88D7|nr:hypothetical protein [Amycolatopsis sp. PS_44_ISF1]MDT8914659.1 hypothetical protein [Amycolatopsis sp. PS_44_ISF1]
MTAETTKRADHTATHDVTGSTLFTVIRDDRAKQAVPSSSGAALVPTITLDQPPLSPTVILVPGGDTGILLRDARDAGVAAAGNPRPVRHQRVLRLAAHLCGDDFARLLELGAEHAPQPPFGTGTPDQAGPALTELPRDLLAPWWKNGEHPARKPPGRARHRPDPPCVTAAHQSVLGSTED